MRYQSRTLERLSLGERPIIVRHGTVMVVARDQGWLDWEVIAQTAELEPVSRDRHELAMRIIDGVTDAGTLSRRDVFGTARLVRAIDHTLVFRGDGPLEGFDPDGFDDSES